MNLLPTCTCWMDDRSSHHRYSLDISSFMVRLQASPEILSARFSIVLDECNLKGVCFLHDPMHESLSFLAQILGNLVRKRLKWLNHQLCSCGGALDLPYATDKAIDQKGRKHH